MGGQRGRTEPVMRGFVWGGTRQKTPRDLGKFSKKGYSMGEDGV